MAHNINSHIQMPKKVLENFQKNGMLAYYNVERKFVGNKGHANSTNTSFGYYDESIETFLNKNLESPFSDILNKIKNIDIKNPEWTTDDKKNKIITDFCISLVFRNPHLRNSFPSYIFCSEKDKNDLMILMGYENINENILQDYFSTISINNTNTPFVLPVCGMYSICCNDEIRILFPVTPKIALTLFPKENINNHIEDSLMDYFSIEEENVIKRFNEKAFETQCGYNWGYVVCPEREELDRLKSWWDNEKNEGQRN